MGPSEWYEPGLKNKRVGGYAVKDYHNSGRVYARPTLELEKKIHALFLQEMLDDRVTNEDGGVCGVKFVYVVPINGTRMHPITGQAPFWHTLAGRRPDRVLPHRHVKNLLMRQVSPGDYGMASQ